MVHISITPEKLTQLFGWPITNTLLTAWLVIGLLAMVAIIIARQLKRSPVATAQFKLAAGAEGFTEGLLGFLDNFISDRQLTIKFFPLAATLFIFILTANWIGILPGVGTIGLIEHGEHGQTLVPLFRSVYSDLNMTLALALLTFVLSHLFGFLAIGPKHHLGKFFNLKSPINFFVGILEAIGELARVISLSFRLFGNIFAGEVLLVIVAFLIPYLAPIPFLALELFVGFIQALIFTVLSTLAYSSAVRVAEH